MEVTLSAWQRLYLGLGAALTEGRGVLFASLLFLSWVLSFWSSNLPLAWPVGTAIVYGLTLYGAVLSLLDGKKYPWFLALKAEQSGRFASFWFRRFHFWILAFIKRNLPDTRQDLFIKNRALWLMKEGSGKDVPQGLPTFAVLERAVSLTFQNIRYIWTRKTQRSKIKSQVAKLRAEFEKAETETFLDGYLRYLITTYVSLPPETRALVTEYEEESLWKRMELYPRTSKLLAWIIAVIALTLLFVLFGESIPFLP